MVASWPSSTWWHRGGLQGGPPAGRQRVVTSFIILPLCSTLWLWPPKPGKIGKNDIVLEITGLARIFPSIFRPSPSCHFVTLMRSLQPIIGYKVYIKLHSYHFDCFLCREDPIAYSEWVHASRNFNKNVIPRRHWTWLPTCAHAFHISSWCWDTFGGSISLGTYFV